MLTKSSVNRSISVSELCSGPDGITVKQTVASKVVNSTRIKSIFGGLGALAYLSVRSCLVVLSNQLI